jgi:RNA polymerase sigma factor (sigma-70 family)
MGLIDKPLLSDEVLKAYRHDRDFFARLHHDHHSAVRAYLMSRAHGLDACDLDDIVQEVFARAWRMRDRFRGAASLRTYLIAIARNVLREFFAQRRRHTASPLSDHCADRRQADLIQRVEQRDLLVRIFRTLDQLSPHQRQALELISIQGKTPAEAAALCSTTVKAMRRRIENARARLAALLAACERSGTCRSAED